MNTKLEIVEQGSTEIQEVYDFWMPEWDRVFQTLIGAKANPNIFYEQSYFYVIKVNNKIAGIMSSAWQSTKDNLEIDQYYEAWPESVNHLRKLGIKNFHKMGMIVAKRDLVPEGFKMAPTIIGCGIRFAQALKNCQGIVSFPRTDNAVYRSCDEWGFRTPKSELKMFNVPVNFVLLMPNEMKSHPNPNVEEEVNQLWSSRTEKLKKPMAA